MSRKDNENFLQNLYFDDLPFCIYGAGIVATSIYTAIKTLYNKKPLFFLVSDTAEGKCDENPTEIDGIEVKRLSKWREEMNQSADRDAASPRLYLVITPETHHPAIVEALHSIDIEDTQIRLFTNEIENDIMEAYYSNIYSEAQNIGTVSSMLSEKMTEVVDEITAKHMMAETIQVFQAKCHVDKALNSPHSNPSYIYPIQVGSALTNQVIAELQDNTGDNISVKNRNYCELTASYYAWKNSAADYKGLCHYRRIFDISDEQMQKLLENHTEWDVILPYSSIHYPNILMQHKRYIKDSDWTALLNALKETAPEYYEAYNELVLSGEKYFYNFNMLIARAEVFDDYCSFLFKVLERAEELTIPQGSERADRFAGYMGENLTTLYFLKNRDKLKILYAGKLWLT